MNEDKMQFAKDKKFKEKEENKKHDEEIRKLRKQIFELEEKLKVSRKVPSKVRSMSSQTDLSMPPIDED
jgi:hypothetical protein